MKFVLTVLTVILVWFHLTLILSINKKSKGHFILSEMQLFKLNITVETLTCFELDSNFHFMTNIFAVCFLQYLSKSFGLFAMQWYLNIYLCIMYCLLSHNNTPIYSFIYVDTSTTTCNKFSSSSSYYHKLVSHSRHSFSYWSSMCDTG